MGKLSNMLAAATVAMCSWRHTLLCRMGCKRIVETIRGRTADDSIDCPGLARVRRAAIVLFRPVTLFAALCCLLAACSGLKTYRSDNQKNLFITTDTEARGWFSGVDAALDIYQMRDECDVRYQGTVNLDDSLVAVGVPAGEAAYLVFRFESSAFLSNTRSSMGYDVALYAAYGQVYDVDVTYRDNIYNVEVQERERGGTEGQYLVVGMPEWNCDSDI